MIKKYVTDKCFIFSVDIEGGIYVVRGKLPIIGKFTLLFYKTQQERVFTTKINPDFLMLYGSKKDES